MPTIAKISLFIICVLLMVLAVKKSHQDAATYTATFNRIYKNKIWAGGGSGWGSDPVHAMEYIQLLREIFENQNYKWIVDLGCGDWQIMQHVNIPNDTNYLGYDVSTNVLAKNTQFAKPNVKFMHTVDIDDFAANGPTADLIIVKDVLQHMPNADIMKFIRYVLPKYKYALITNDYTSHKEGYINTDIKLGAYRPLRLQSPPFNLKNVEIVLEYKGPEDKQVILYKNTIN